MGVCAKLENVILVLKDNYNILMEIIEILRKKQPILVRKMLVGDLKISKCSYRFREKNLPSDTHVFVKCNVNGEFDLRGAKMEYRIIIPDNEWNII